MNLRSLDGSLVEGSGVVGIIIDVDRVRSRSERNTEMRSALVKDRTTSWCHGTQATCIPSFYASKPRRLFAGIIRTPRFVSFGRQTFVPPPAVGKSESCFSRRSLADRFIPSCTIDLIIIPGRKCKSYHKCLLRLSYIIVRSSLPCLIASYTQS